MPAECHALSAGADVRGVPEIVERQEISMGRMDELNARINSRMDAMNRRLAERMAALDARLGGSEPSPQTVARAAQKAVPSDVVRTGSASARIKAALPSALPGVPSTCPEQWDMSDAEILQLLSYVSTSPHVTTNSRYSSLVPELAFKVVRDEPAINAFAAIRDGKPSIFFLAGAIRYANLISAAYVASKQAQLRFPDRFSPLPEIVEALGTIIQTEGARLTAEKVCAFAELYNLHCIMYDQVLARKAKTLAAGLVVGIIAHEFGHLALGHLHGESRTLEISRNQEREADCFASSVISSSPFGDYMVLGSILWETLWVWLEKQPGGSIETTHPLASERLANLIHANPTVAAELGFEVPDGTSLLSDMEKGFVLRQASDATPENAKFDWTSGVSCAFGCLGECRGN